MIINTGSKVPTSLPANGGNADTVDGKHANDFLTSNAVTKLTTSLNNVWIPLGTYSCEKDYTPDFSSEYGYYGLLDVRAYGSIMYQTMYFDNGIVINRANIRNASVETEWSKWTVVSNTSNPNLLINPDFKINQRGQTTYIGDWIYSVDRWISFGCSIEYSTDAGLIVNKTDAAEYFSIMQRIENELKPGQYSISFNVNNADNTDNMTYSGTGLLTDSNTGCGFNFPYGRIEVYKNLVQFYITESSSITLNWVKLELGSVATPFVPPDPATELTKCQRYYEILMSNNIDRHIMGYINPTTRKANFDIPFKVTKRVAPSLTNSNIRLTVTDLSTDTFAFVGYVNASIYSADCNGMMIITDAIDNSYTLNVNCVATIDTCTTGDFAVSAEL